MFNSSNFLNVIKTIWHITLLPLWGGLWAFGLGVLAWYPLRWWPGDQWVVVRLINYFVPWLLLGLLPGLLLAVWGRRYSLAALLLLPILLIILTYAPLFTPRPATALAADGSLKVMSYNIWGRNRTLDQAVELIKAEQADIVLLQEDYRQVSPKIHDQLTNLYPDGQLYLVYEPAIGQAVISRYPITRLDASYAQGRTQKVLVDTPGGEVEVWNVHTHAPNDWTGQYRQITALVRELPKVERPLIVGGDFNTTDQSETYQFITQYLRNAHWESGWGFGFSFPAHSPRFKRIPIITPMVRIDHIFYNSYFYATAAQTLSESGGSDHFPITANLMMVP